MLEQEPTWNKQFTRKEIFLSFFSRRVGTVLGVFMKFSRVDQILFVFSAMHKGLASGPGASESHCTLAQGCSVPEDCCESCVHH